MIFNSVEDLIRYLDKNPQEAPRLAIEFYEKCYIDQLTGIPNGIKCREDLKQLNGSSHIYFMDIVGLKSANDGFGYNFGDALIVYISNLLRKVFSDFGDGTVYREHGDEFIAIANTNEEQARVIKDTIERYCQITNIVKGSYILSGVSEVKEEEGEIVDWVNSNLNNIEVYGKKVSLPLTLPVMVSIGYSYSAGRPFESLDEARRLSKESKRLFYNKYPDLDPRKNGDYLQKLNGNS